MARGGPRGGTGTGGAALPPAQQAQVGALNIDPATDALVVVDGATGEVVGNANVTISADGRTFRLGENTMGEVRVTGGSQPGGGPVDVGGDGTLNGAIVRAFAKALILPLTNAIAWTTGAAVNAAISMTLRPMGERILGLVNGTDRQTFRVYDTYTDDANYRAVEFSHTDDAVIVGVAAAGAAAGDVGLNLVTGGAGQVMVNGAPFKPIAFTANYNDLVGAPDLSVFNDLSSFARQSDFPSPGETGKLYLAQDTGHLYRWNGSSYVIVSGQLALGTGANDAGRGSDVAANTAKLAGIEDGAQVNVPSDWNATTGPAQILNKPPNLVTTTGNHKITGRLGFGTDTPGYPIDVVGNTASTTRIRFTRGTGEAHFGAQAKGAFVFGEGEQSFFVGKTAPSIELYISGEDGRNIGVGTTNPDEKLHVAGNARVDGHLFLQGVAPFLHARATNGTSGIRVNVQGSSDPNGLLFRLQRDGATALSFYGNGDIVSAFDGTSNLGRSTNRWGTVFASNGVNQTSDAQFKSEVRDLSAAEIRAALAIKTKAYRRTDLDDNKLHIGVIAQEVIAAFAAEGLNARDYALVSGEGTEADPYAVAYSQLEALRLEALKQKLGL